MADAGYLDATLYTLSEPATLFALSIHLGFAGGEVALAVYADNAGTPSTLLVAASPQPALDGWNTLHIPYTTLPAGNYWLALQVQNFTEVGYDYPATRPNSEYWVGRAYGPFPSTYPAGNFDRANFAIYGSYCPDLSFPTVTPTWTATASPTAALVWTQVAAAAAFPGRQVHGSALFDAGSGMRMWVAGGVDGGTTRMNDVWSSADGLSWSAATTAAAFPARQGHSLLSHDEDGAGVQPRKLWVIGGWDGATVYGDVWNSTDGAAWNPVTTAPFAPRYAHASVVFDDGSGPGPRLWIIGGYDGVSTYNDVWASRDGVIWTQITASAGFSPRYYPSCTVYNNRIWLFGGGSGSTYFTDVWSSADGAVWQQELATVPFAPRIGHVLLTHDDGTAAGNRLWVVSGYGGSYGFQPNVWSSADGKAWVLEDGNTPFGARAGHTSLSHLGRLWVIAGFSGTSMNVTNDVWSAP
jgi:hypothetical protein